MNRNRLVGLGSLGVALVVGTLTLACMQRAVATVSAPGAVLYSFSLADGGNSSKITVAADRPVFVIANSTTPGDRGTAHMSLEHASGAFLEWSGLNSPNEDGPPTITGNFSGAAGTNMLQCDYWGPSTGLGLFLQISTADSFVVHNHTGAQATGYVLVLN
jgi:hypothetical protein